MLTQEPSGKVFSAGYLQVEQIHGDVGHGRPRALLHRGFLGSDNETVHGRPVGLALDRSGALLVADDVGNTVWRVSATQPGT